MNRDDYLNIIIEEHCTKKCFYKKENCIGKECTLFEIAQVIRKDSNPIEEFDIKDVPIIQEYEETIAILKELNKDKKSSLTKGIEELEDSIKNKLYKSMLPVDLPEYKNPPENWDEDDDEYMNICLDCGEEIDEDGICACDFLDDDYDEDDFSEEIYDMFQQSLKDYENYKKNKEHKIEFQANGSKDAFEKTCKTLKKIIALAKIQELIPMVEITDDIGNELTLIGEKEINLVLESTNFKEAYKKIKEYRGNK